MITSAKQSKIDWIDVEAPTKEEIGSLTEKFQLEPLIASELLKPTLHPKADAYRDSLYLVLHFPFFDQKTRASRSREIDFIIGKNYIITVHYENIEPFKSAAKEGNKKTHDELNYFFHLIHALYSFSLRELDHIQKKIDAVENNIFGGREKETVESLSFLMRDILNFRRALYAHKSIFESLEKTGERFFGKNFNHHLVKIEGERFRLWNLLENSRETVETLKETNNSLLATKTNEVMKILTTVALITFSLTLIASIFGMNAKYAPLIGEAGDFWIIISLMSAVTLIMLVFFKIKRWI